MGHQDEEEAWSSSQPSYYPAQTQYTYAYSNPAVHHPAVQQGYNQAGPQAGGIGIEQQHINEHYNAGPPPPLPNYNPDPTPASAPADVEGGKPANLPNMAFSEASIRAAFIRKVFGLVTLMLLIVVAECAVAVFVPSVNKWMMGDGDDYTSLYVMGGMCVLFFVLYFTILCVERLRKSFPVNIILAFLMAGALGFLMAQLCAFFTVDSIILCVGLLVVSVASIALFSCQTRFDMRNCAGIAILLTMYLFWIGIFSFGYMYWWIGAYWLNMVWSVLACTLFMIYLAIDIQMIMGGRRHSISPEEYVYAAVQIFIDVVYIFYYLLLIFGVVKN